MDKKTSAGAGEMAYRLRSLATLPDSVLFPSTTWRLTTNSRESGTLFWAPQVLHVRGASHPGKTSKTSVSVCKIPVGYSPLLVAAPKGLDAREAQRCVQKLCGHGRSAVFTELLEAHEDSIHGSGYRRFPSIQCGR